MYKKRNFLSMFPYIRKARVINSTKARTHEILKRMNHRIFPSPIHWPIQGQWWSCPTMQTLQSPQWYVRSGSPRYDGCWQISHQPLLLLPSRLALQSGTATGFMIRRSIFTIPALVCTCIIYCFDDVKEYLDRWTHTEKKYCLCMGERGLPLLWGKEIRRRLCSTD